MYDEKLVTSSLGFDYEYGRSYAHFLIQGVSNEPEKVIEDIQSTLKQEFPEFNFYINLDRDFSLSSKED